MPSLSGIVVETRQWHGRQIQCIHGGGWPTTPKACGTLDYEYERVFTGTIQSVTEISDTDRRLEIRPDEIFLGDFKGNVTFDSACVDANGNFEARGVEPGRYVVGLGIQPGTGYFSDVPTPVYYPGVQTKEQATIIQPGRAEKRTNVNFELPADDVVKFMKQPPIPPADVLHINIAQPVNQ